jgi:hypothetical protein
LLRTQESVQVRVEGLVLVLAFVLF